jgi:hypothetical protein
LRAQAGALEERQRGLFEAAFGDGESDEAHGLDPLMVDPLMLDPLIVDPDRVLAS